MDASDAQQQIMARLEALALDRYSKTNCGATADVVQAHTKLLGQIESKIDTLMSSSNLQFQKLDEITKTQANFTTKLALIEQLPKLPSTDDSRPEIVVEKGVFKVDLKKIDWTKVTAIGTAISAIIIAVWDKISK